MANYRRWIYSVNCSIIVVEFILVACVMKTISKTWWYLIPIDLKDVTFIIYTTLIVLQFFTCLCGLAGVLFSSGRLLSAYWLLMVPLLIMDAVMTVPLVEHMSAVHRNIAAHIEKVVNETIKCDVWNSIQSTHNCCAPSILHSFCQSDETWSRPMHCADRGGSCDFHILRMMHKETDILGILIYYVLVPLKFVVVFVLRKDVSHVFSQIVYLHAMDSLRIWEGEDDEVDIELSPCSVKKSDDHVHDDIQMPLVRK